MNFLDYLEDIQSAGPNLHQTHLEDEILSYGKDGMLYIAEILQTIAKDGLTDKFKITVKFDGSPALIFGILPSDVTTSNGVSMKKGSFFVGTKGVFNATPKIAPTAKATEELYGGELGKIMGFAFEYLQKIYQGNNVYQGDLMFAEIADRKKVIRVIDNQKYFTFKPNTIIYTIPVSSEEGQKIYNKKFGIVVHTKYTGENLDDMHISFNVSENEFKINSDVWLVDAKRKNINGGSLLLPEDAKRIDGMGRYIIDNLNKIEDSFFDDMKKFQPEYLFATFLNVRIRNGNKKIIDDIDAFITEFKEWMTSRTESEKRTIKTDKGKARRDEILKNNLAIIDNNKESFVQLLKVYKVVIKAKSMIIEALNNSTQSLQTFLQTDAGLIRTNPEGYCVVNINEKISKLVNRLEFSKANFQKDI
jgi:hypothetical protein